MMQGISGSGMSGSMPTNCGMAGMHGNPPVRKGQINEEVQSVSNLAVNVNKPSEPGKGNILDISI